MQTMSWFRNHTSIQIFEPVFHEAVLISQKKYIKYQKNNILFSVITEKILETLVDVSMLFHVTKKRYIMCQNQISLENIY